MEITTEYLEKALSTLKEAWAEYQKDTSNSFVRDSVTQRFEYTFELSHKLLRRFLSETETSRADISEMIFFDIIRLGCKRGLLLNDLETWDKYRKLRNLTSHNYDEFNTENIIISIPVFIEEIDYEIKKINEKINQSPVALHLDKKHLNTITSIIKSIPELDKSQVYFFGSRIQGKSVKFSDVDIAIDFNEKPIPDEIKSKLLSLFENSTLPYQVDIIDLNSVTESFRLKVEKDFTKLPKP